MADEGFKRKLAAILSADVEGYSRLMDDDEEATVRTLTSYRNAIADLTQQYRGRIVDSPGDNILAEFSSVVDAVNCAVEIQRELGERNTELPYKRQMQFRIGVNLGDVIEEDGRIYGDGVNIAARVESLAEPGGICVSSRAYEQVMNKLGLKYEDLGEHQVKNIRVPIRVYKVLSFPGAAAHRVAQAKESLGRRWRKIAVLAVALIAVVGGLAYWQFYMRSPDIEPASAEKMAFPLPEKPSIAVLPFVNMSGDPEQEYIADSITENIITALSYIPEMFVIARTSTSVYKDKAVKIKQVSEELGVRYVLEGSIQKAENQIRVTVQLIDAITGHHLWADRYDRTTDDFFSLLDEIAKKVAIELQVNLTEGDIARISHKTENFDAWASTTIAYSLTKKIGRENIVKAKELCEKAIKLDPDYGFAWGTYGAALGVEGMFGWGENRAKSFKLANEYTDKAIELDENLSCATAVKGRLLLREGKFDEAIAVGRRAIEMAPSHHLSYGHLGVTTYYAGNFRESISLIEKAMRLDPNYPAWYLDYLARDYFHIERYGKAIEAWQSLLTRSKRGEYAPLNAHLGLSAAFIGLGKGEEASAHATKVLEINPKFNLDSFAKTRPYKNKADLDQYLESLRKAGLPEHHPLPLPDKPSIAVLAFENLSGDPKQEYFSDGITDDLITDLSKISGLFVVARNSTFSFKGQHKKVQQIGKELGVQYVLEGSVQKYGDKVRINAQLIDAQTGGHLWAERYDRDFREIFALQDEVIAKIISMLSVKLTGTEQDLVGSQITGNLKAYDYYLRGMGILHDLTGKGLSKAKSMFEQAIKHDPNFAHAYAAHAMANLFIYRLKIIDAGITPKEAHGEAYEYVNTAIELNSNVSTAYSVLGSLELVKGNFDKAIDFSRKAVNINTNDPEGYVILGYILSKAGDHKAGLEMIRKAFRLDPIPPHYYYYYLGHVQVNNKLYKEAVETIKKAGPNTPDSWSHELLVSYAYLNEMDRAKRELKKILTTRPRSNIYWAMVTLAFKRNEDKDHWAKAYRKVGLPEYPYSYEGDKNNILSKKEILDLIVGKTLTGIDPEKGQLWMHHSKDGAFRITGSYELFGKYWFEGNKLCWSYKKFPGYVDYIFFYLNPDGSFEDKNEYHMFFALQGTLPISVEK